MCIRDSVQIEAGDLRVDTYRASGAGGQHVNRTDSAVRLTHLPTGMVVECQDERSQHKNKARALSILRSRLLEAEQHKQNKEVAEKVREVGLSAVETYQGHIDFSDEAACESDLSVF